MKKIAILGTGDADRPGDDTPAPLVAAAGHATPLLVSVPGAVFPESPAAAEQCADAYLRAGLDAEARGFDGLYINTVGDYGVSALRAAARVPVTGAGESGINIARANDRQFAIVTIWPPRLRFIYDAVLTANDAVQDCLAIYHLSEDPELATLPDPDNFVRAMQSCTLTSMAKIRDACRRAVEEDGAAAIMLGCTCMQPVAALLAVEGWPVIEPMTEGYRRLEDLMLASGA